MDLLIQTFLEPFTIAALFMVADIATGWLAAIKNGTVSSSKMREGLWHKSGFIMLIVLAYGLDVAGDVLRSHGYHFSEGVSLDGLSPILFCGYIVVTEVVSIFENICSINPEVSNSPLGLMLHSDGFKIKKGAINGTSKKTAKSKKQ